MASYAIYSYDHESVTLYISGVSVGDAIRVFCRYYDDTSSSVHNQSFAATQASFFYTINGLEPETEYVINVGSKDSVSSETTTWWGGQTFTTDAAPSVDPWYWTISNGSATAAQTKAAYTAITSGGYLSSFNYLVWNDLVNKCYEAITARGGSWVTSTITVSGTSYGNALSYAKTLMTSSDKEMTAARFNAVWWQCSQYINTGMGASSGGYCPVSTGDTIKGSYFIDLANAINNTIY